MASLVIAVILLSKCHVLILASNSGSLWAFCKGPVGAINLEKVQTFLRIAFGPEVGFAPGITVEIQHLIWYVCLWLKKDCPNQLQVKDFQGERNVVSNLA